MDPKQRAALTRTGKHDLKDLVRNLRSVNGPESGIQTLPRRLSLIELFAQETRFLRSSRTKPSLIVPLLLNRLQFPPHTNLKEAGITIANQVDSELAAPNYHNQHHVVEVIVAAYVLGRREKLSDLRIAELVIAAAAHDLGHTGQMNQFDYERESCSVEIALPILVEHQVPEVIRRRIEKMILATDFKVGVPPARSEYNATRDLEADDERRLLASQCLLLTEADVLFSCFDLDYNDLLSQLLSAEWQRDEENLPLKERIGFVSYVQFISDAANQLGLEPRRQRLLQQLQDKLNPPPAAA